MCNKSFKSYYLWACAGLLLASIYPLYMGVRVVADMLQAGTVMQENYPKYIIPYTPISLALLVGLGFMPICMKLFHRLSLLAGAALAVGVFFAAELLLEQNVVISGTQYVTKLEHWQMYMCALPVVQVQAAYTPVELLMGDYTPAFKLHFYMISILLILSLLNCLYGFGQLLCTGDRTGLKLLTVQSGAALAFLGLCILACFTAFWRDGNLQVSPLSAGLMALFFTLLGIVGGVFAGFHLAGKRPWLSVGLPALAASALTLLMYIGEMILLSGHLYRFGEGFFFAPMAGIVLAPVDVLIILTAGGLTAMLLGGKTHKSHS